MKRLVFLLALLLVPAVAQAFDRERPDTIRIGILRTVVSKDSREIAAVTSIPAQMRDVLRREGFDAFTTDATIDELAQREERDADFYVEVLGNGVFEDAPAAGVGIYGRDFHVGVGVVSTEVQAQINVYAGESLDLIASYDLRGGRTTVAPVGAGIGRRPLYAFVGIPISYWQYRSAARQVAKDAAVKVAETVREP